MNDQQHPITPPPELKRQWRQQIPRYCNSDAGREERLIEFAAEWGYDQRGEVNEAKLQQARDEELEACIAWFDKHIPGYELVADKLRAARRPKPPSLKEKALEALDEALFMADDDPPEGICSDQADIIRKALEALPDA